MHENLAINELPPADISQLNETFEAIAAYKADPDHNPLTGAIVHEVSKSSAYDRLIESGLDPADAARNVEAVEADPRTEHAADHGLLGLTHGDILAQAGLKLGSDPEYPRILVVNATQLCSTLDQEIPNPDTKDRLVNNLDGFFEEIISTTQRDLARHRTHDIQRILGDDFKPNEWMPVAEDPLFGDAQPAEEKASLSIILEDASQIAEKYRNLGGNSQTAAVLENLGAFEEDSDLMHWVTAGELGLLPETADEYEGHLWQQWNTASDWSPAFKLLDTANPIGRFRPHLAHSILEHIDQELELAHSELALDAETYVAREKQQEASQDTSDSFDEEDLDLTSTDEELRNAYENSREDWQTHIAELSKVRQKLVDQYVAY